MKIDWTPIKSVDDLPKEGYRYLWTRKSPLFVEKRWANYRESKPSDYVRTFSAWAEIDPIEPYEEEI